MSVPDQMNLRCADEKKEVALSTRADQLLAAANRAVIDSTDNEKKGTDLSKLFRTAIKATEEERTFLVGPFNKGVKQINDRFKLITNPLKEGKAVVDKKLLAFKVAEQRKLDEEAARQRKEEEEQRRKAMEEQRKAEEEARKTGCPQPEPAPVQEPELILPVKREPVRTDRGTSSIRKVWVYDVVDIAALATSMPGLVTVNCVEIYKLVRAGEREIAGLRIYQKDTLTVR